MHPLISIISFIVCAISLSLSITIHASLVTILVCSLVLFSIDNGWQRWFHLVRRLRWFWISLAVLYIGFTPGVAIWPALFWSPTYEGVTQGSLRILILLDIFTLVFILHSKNTRQRVVAGLHALCWPLQFKTGLRDKLVKRLILTFEYVERIPEIYHQVKQSINPEMSRVNKIVYVLRNMIHNTANGQESDSVTFQYLPYPHWYEWSYPFMIATLYYWIITYFNG